MIKESYEPLEGQKQVKKPVFGRESGSVSILDADGNGLGIEDDYDSHKMVYQAYTQLATDAQGLSLTRQVYFMRMKPVD